MPENPQPDERLLRVHYCPEPTLALFHDSNAFVRGVMGPVGSGKSVAMCMEILDRAARQPPGPDGRRQTRFAVVRNTYPELKSTTMRTWSDWVPLHICPVKGSGPYCATMAQPLDDGTSIDLELIFLALARDADIRKLLSLELTGAWINEAREVPRTVLDGLSGRVGRFPSLRAGGPAWSGIIMDTNPPDEDHWWYALAEENRPDNWEFFRQPPAVLQQGNSWRANPEAENAKHQPLGSSYWLRQAFGKSREWIRVYLQGAYGSVHNGRPVYPEYDDALHVPANPPVIIHGRPLLLGWDFGLTPACVISQCGMDGQLVVLDEIIGNDLGIRRFVRDTVQPYLSATYPGASLESWGDPAGRMRSQTDERTCMDELASAGLPTRGARTNDFAARREAVAGFLSAPSGRSRFVLSPRCRTLRKGFLGGYRMERLTTGEGMFADKPVKNSYSHIHDALQYAALAAEASKGEGAAHNRQANRGGQAFGVSRRKTGFTITSGNRPADGLAGY